LEADVRGTVKWYNPVKGYGFIAREDESADLFVHLSALKKSGLSKLAEGEFV
jgi:CspA family cold shock protein